MTIIQPTTPWEWTRRDFLVLSGSAGAAALLAPRPGLAQPTVRMAVVGLGNRGREHVQALCAVPGLEIAAICDRSSRPLARCQALLRRTGRADVPGFADIASLVQVDEVDAVAIATPADAAVHLAAAACRAGKHVFLDRPGWPTLGAGRALAGVAGAAGRFVQLRTRALPVLDAATAKQVVTAEPRAIDAVHIIHRPANAGAQRPAERLHNLLEEVDFALEVLAASRLTQVTAMGLTPEGEIPGRARVSYLFQGPRRSNQSLTLDVLGPFPLIPSRGVGELGHLEPGASRIAIHHGGSTAAVAVRPASGEQLSVELAAFAGAVREGTRTATQLPLSAAVVAADLLSRAQDAASHGGQIRFHGSGRELSWVLGERGVRGGRCGR